MEPLQNGWHFVDYILKCLSINMIILFWYKFQMFVPKGPIGNNSELDQACCQIGKKS